LKSIHDSCIVLYNKGIVRVCPLRNTTICFHIQINLNLKENTHVHMKFTNFKTNMLHESKNCCKQTDCVTSCVSGSWPLPQVRGIQICFNFKHDFWRLECEEMPSSEESMCCRSSEYVQPNIDKLKCITEHPQFQLLILNPDVLTVAFIQIMIYKRQPGRAPDNLTNKRQHNYSSEVGISSHSLQLYHYWLLVTGIFLLS
jgi:hypothetical protein